MWLENVKNWPISENKKIWILVVSKPENNKFSFNTAIETKFKISKMNKHSFFAETELQIDQIKKKKEEKFIKQLFI